MNYKKEDEFIFLSEKLQEMLETMDAVQGRFKNRLRFMMSVMIFNEGNATIDQSVNVHNVDLNTRDIELFSNFLISKHKQLRIIENEYVLGDKIVVICENDKKLPKKLMKAIQRGYIYRINEIKVNKKGKFVYRLEGINDREQFTLLNASRFSIVTNYSKS